MVNNKMNMNELRGRLLELVYYMSEAETLVLLKELGNKNESNKEVQEKRKYPRKDTFLTIDCSGNICTFTDFIQNISVGGLYIETQIPLFVDQELSMSFFLSDNETSIKITGSIVRVDEIGYWDKISQVFSKRLNVSLWILK